MAALFLCVLSHAQAQTQLRVPAFTAYFEPDPDGATVSRSAISDWTNPALKVVWFGDIIAWIQAKRDLDVGDLRDHRAGERHRPEHVARGSRD